MSRIVAIALLLSTASYALADEPPLRVMSALLYNLHKGIQAACSCLVDGVSVPQWSSYPDVSQWRIDWRPATTDAQKQRGYNFMKFFDPNKAINRTPPQ